MKGVSLLTQKGCLVCRNWEYHSFSRYFTCLDKFYESRNVKKNYYRINQISLIGENLIYLRHMIF